MSPGRADMRKVDIASARGCSAPCALATSAVYFLGAAATCGALEKSTAGSHPRDLAGPALSSKPGTLGEASRAALRHPLGVPNGDSLAALVCDRLPDVVAVAALGAAGAWPGWRPLLNVGPGAGSYGLQALVLARFVERVHAGAPLQVVLAVFASSTPIGAASLIPRGLGSTEAALVWRLKSAAVALPPFRVRRGIGHSFLRALADLADRRAGPANLWPIATAPPPMNELAIHADVPLVIDLDGTLVRADLLHESALHLLRDDPLAALRIPLWLAQGRAALKAQIAQRVELDAATLPYHRPLVEWIRAERAQGRHTVLCTASNQRYADAVAAHLGVFDEVLASDAQTNVSARRKAQLLVERFGAHGFDYAGNSADDLQVWPQARRAIVVNASAAVAAEARQRFEVSAEWPLPQQRAREALRALRLHQWVKNLLVLLPLAGAHQLGDTALLLQAVVAFFAFSLCASAVYVLNDLMDVESDRAHPRKRGRPFASGALSVPLGFALAALLLAGTVALAASARPLFQWCLASYFALTLAYTFFLKRRVIVDCLTLGGLYTIRIVAGWCAVGIAASFWLLAFSLFLFLSLAFVKRYSELLVMSQLGRHDARGRGYLATDLPLVLVLAMGVAAGFGSVMLLALYINGDTVLRHYSQPEVLWLTVPIQLYWVSRMWMQAQRGHMHDDPVVFALRDRYSWVCGVLFGLTLAVAR